MGVVGKEMKVLVLEGVGVGRRIFSTLMCAVAALGPTRTPLRGP
ncbi:hypothetical protein COLO4_17320 [Corchorus olitorius]|uniref:Uncharacterized protein n=1 Tax=Corchorus olitorius TaxID=93759 RepID=A0A1R3JD63_9ROSI|nr:hypothetical protein COLO4_17320 [Corchorus olitorius]